MNSFRKSEIIALIFLVFNTILFTGIFYYDLTKSAGSGTNEDIGYITFKFNTIQRKFDSQIIWKNLYQNSVLKNRDTIQTYEDSDAMISLNDGTSIQIDENSLIYLDLNPTQKNIQFNAGSIQVKTGAKNFQIQSQGKNISLENGNFHFQKRDNEDLQITVDKGKAKFQVNGKTHDLNESQMVKIGENTMEITDLPFQLVHPDNQKKIVTSSKNNKIKFQWEAKPNYSDVEVQVSKNRDFSNIIKRSKDKGTATFPLDSGTYYWRVVGKNKEGKFEIGESRKFMVLEDRPIELIYPHNNQSVNISTKNEVYFSWTVSPINSKYKLEISQDSDFKDIVKSVTVNYNSINVYDLKKGKYFWRVTNVPLSDDIEPIVSKTNSFTLFEAWQDKSISSLIDTDESKKPEDNTQDKESTAKNDSIREIKPESLSPNKARIDVQKTKSILFQWEKIPVASEYKVSIKNAQKKDKIVYQAKTKINQLLFKEFSSLEIGKFKWEVYPIQKDSESHPDPATGTFEIIYHNQLKKLNPEDIEILSPETIYRD